LKTTKLIEIQAYPFDLHFLTSRFHHLLHVAKMKATSNYTTLILIHPILVYRNCSPRHARYQRACRWNSPASLQVIKVLILVFKMFISLSLHLPGKSITKRRIWMTSSMSWWRNV